MRSKAKEVPSTPLDVGALAGDEHGAVLFMGLFMALFLVGSLWFLIGMGDAIVVRQAAQEATDAAVFSSAAIHAKGMNIIAFLNCLMLAIVFIYLLLALVVDVILFVAGLAIAGIYTIELVPALVDAAEAVDDVAKGYKEGMAVALPLFAGIQTAVAYLAPWGGTVAAGYISHKYGFFTVAVGPSNIPGSDASVLRLLDKASGGAVAKVLPKDSGRLAAFDGATKKLGLPVKTMKMNFLCKVALSWVLDKLLAILGVIPLVGTFKNPIRNFLSNALGASVSAIHCRESGSGAAFDPKDLYDKKPASTRGGSQSQKDAAGAASASVGSLGDALFAVYAAEDWWSDKNGGPKALYSGDVKNGSEWTQIWAWTPKRFDDAQEHGVRVGTFHAGDFHGMARAPSSQLYTAQAEFYYDCKDGWKADGCNGDDVYDYTMYSMRWRARLVRYRGFGLSTFGSLFADFIGAFLTTNKMASWFKEKLGVDKLGGAVDGMLPDLFKGRLANDGKNNQEDLFTKALKKVVSASKGALAPAPQGSQALH